MNDVVAMALVGAVLVAGALITIGWRRRHLAGGRAFALMAVGGALWSGANAAQVVSDNHVIKHITVVVAYLGICLVSFFVWRCMTQVAGPSRLTSPVVIRLLAIPAFITVLLVITSDLQRLMFAELKIPDGPGPVTSEIGPWFIVHLVWAYGLIMGGVVAFARAVLRAPPHYRRLAILMIAAVALPLAANAFALGGIVDLQGHDPTPLALMLTAAAMGWGILRMRLIDAHLGLLPVARSVVVESMHDGVVVIDSTDRVLDMNPAAADLLGTKIDGAIGEPIAALMSGWRLDDDAPTLTWEFPAGTPHVPLIIEATLGALDGGHEPGRLLMLRDVTVRRAAERTLAESAERHLHQSRHDPLTGLPNRVLLFDELRAALRALPPPRGSVALLILDLDGFKDLNDTFGHRAGDDVLRGVAPRLGQAAGSRATVARLAGDEFAILVADSDPDDAMAVAERIVAIFRVPFVVDETEVTLGGSVGIALAPQHGTDADGLVHAADVAMYHAKRTVGRAVVYTSDADVRRPDRLILRQELRRALIGREIGLHYQPQATPDGVVVGVEALARWHHPTRGLLQPSEFLSISEEGELMCELTDVVLDLALAHAARGNAADAGIRMAVNLSAQDLRDPRLASRITEALERNHQPATVLTLEVTENALVLARDAGRQLERIRTSGARISLDDFGTGFGPLASLRELAVDEIKIDRSFVGSIDCDDRAQALVGGLIRLGHDLGAMIVAEGVETQECADRLHEMGCDVLQGFLIGRPRPDVARGPALERPARVEDPLLPRATGLFSTST